MPSEIRHVLFRPAEVVHAVKEYYRRSQQSHPRGTVLHCAAEATGTGGAVRFRITIAPDTADGPQQDVVIEGPTLAAALILHCKIRQIPLPAGGEKSLQCFGEQLGLVVATGSKYDRSAQSAQLHL